MGWPVWWGGMEVADMAGVARVAGVARMPGVARVAGVAGVVATSHPRNPNHLSCS